MTTKTINLYEFKELSDAAKKKAREWWRQCESEDFGAHGDIYEAYETAAKLIGIEFKQRAVRLMSGKDRYESAIYWSLDGQGQGASWEGSYSYARGASKAVRAEFGTDAELWRIADELTKLQRAYTYRLACQVTTDGCETHKYAMSLEWTESGYSGDVKADDEKALLELMRDFADWIFAGIKDEFESRMTDEYVDDAITANEYTFTADGKRED